MSSEHAWCYVQQSSGNLNTMSLVGPNKSSEVKSLLWFLSNMIFHKKKPHSTLLLYTSHFSCHFPLLSIIQQVGFALFFRHLKSFLFLTMLHFQWIFNPPLGMMMKLNPQLRNLPQKKPQEVPGKPFLLNSSSPCSGSARRQTGDQSQPISGDSLARLLFPH